MEETVSRSERLLAAISYAGPLFLLSLFIGGTRFVRLHVISGGLLYALSLLFDIIFFLLPGVGAAVLWAERTLLLLLCIAGVVRAARGSEKGWHRLLAERFCKRFVNFTENIVK